MLPVLTSSAQIFKTSDHYFDRMLAGLDSEDLLKRVGTGNSVLWIAGHITVGRCRLLTLLGEDRSIPWADIFGKGSAEKAGVVFPAFAKVLEVWESARESLNVRLETLTEEDLAQEAPHALPETGKSVLGWINYLAYHEAYHIGQISQARKSMGRGLKTRTIDVVKARMHDDMEVSEKAEA